MVDASKKGWSPEYASTVTVVLGANGTSVPMVHFWFRQWRNMRSAKLERDGRQCMLSGDFHVRVWESPSAIHMATEYADSAASCTVMLPVLFRPCPKRSASPTRCLLALALVVGVQACKRAPEGVTISGDVADLDSIGLRGDALIAQAGGMPGTFDSLRVTADPTHAQPNGVSSNAASGAPLPPPLPGVNPMTARALARGDSMARASALRMISGANNGRSRGDTLRGVVTLVGAEPTKQVMLKVVGNANPIALSGMATAGLSRLVGVELMVRGVIITPRDVVVSDYLVRAVNGVPAYDGRLESGDSGVFLLLTDGSGRKPVAALPAPLQGMNGTRVWIAMKPGTRTVTASGVIGRR